MRTKLQTITDNLSLFQAHNEARLKKIRREIRATERRLWWSRIRQFMKKTKTAAMLLVGMVALVGQVKAYPLIVESPPGINIVALQYGVMQAVTSVHLPCRGKWTISGGSTVQLNVVHPEWGYVPNTVKPSAFLYTAAAFSLDPNQLPVDGTADLQAHSYVTAWFPASPREHTMLVDYDGATVYLVVQYWGQIPADYVQAFGSMMATIDIP